VLPQEEKASPAALQDQPQRRASRHHHSSGSDEDHEDGQPLLVLTVSRQAAQCHCTGPRSMEPESRPASMTMDFDAAVAALATWIRRTPRQATFTCRGRGRWRIVWIFFLVVAVTRLLFFTTEHPPQNCVETDASYVSIIFFGKKRRIFSFLQFLVGLYYRNTLWTDHKICDAKLPFLNNKKSGRFEPSSNSMFTHLYLSSELKAWYKRKLQKPSKSKRAN
jgi:hypothetical protein